MLNFPIDHIGIAVADLERSIQEYSSRFGAKVECRETIAKDSVEAVFLTLPNTDLELISPQPSAPEESPLRRFLAARGPGLHHICFRVPDIRAEMQRLVQSEMKLIDHQPRPGGRESLVAFLHPKSADGVLIELCQRKVQNI